MDAMLDRDLKLGRRRAVFVRKLTRYEHQVLVAKFMMVQAVTVCLYHEAVPKYLQWFGHPVD
jgi:hypothetical protein